MQVLRDVVRDGSTDRTETKFRAVSYLHMPWEARLEMEQVGSEVVLFGIEGPAWIATDFDDRWGRPDGRFAVLEVARACEELNEFLALSGHLLGVFRVDS